jgi:hypothetical protein
MKEYTVVNDTSYILGTPVRLIMLMEKLRQDRTRIRIVYGDPLTGIAWVDAVPERGRIGRSTGNSKIPLLVKTSRSLGGGAILTDKILQVYSSPEGKLLYDHKACHTT